MFFYHRGTRPFGISVSLALQTRGVGNIAANLRPSFAGLTILEARWVRSVPRPPSGTRRAGVPARVA